MRWMRRCGLAGFEQGGERGAAGNARYLKGGGGRWVQRQGRQGNILKGSIQ